MRGLAARAYFALCLALGRLLRSARYAATQIVSANGEWVVRKHRRLYAPLLVWLGAPLLRILDTGVRVLPQRDWEAREREIYRSLRNSSIRTDQDGTLHLPLLAGRPLAELLEDPAVEPALRRGAIQLAAVSLARFHSLGFTHGDAMAENVIVDLEAGAAHWFDFETVHDRVRPPAWRRADDLRALLATTLVRTAADEHAATLDLMLEAYADDEVARALAATFASIWRRALTFHLAQGPLSLHAFQEIGRLLQQRVSQSR